MAGQSQSFDFMMNAMKNMGMDREKMMESQRKNIETMNEVNKKAMEVMRSVSEMQQQYIKQTFEGISSMMKDMMGSGVQKDAWQKHAENLKKHMNHSVDHGVTIANTLGQSHKEIYEKMKGHVAEHMQKATAPIKKSSKQH